MKLLYLLIVTLISIFTTAQDTYDYTTSLKGGYTILYKTDKEQQYLFLQKDGRTICELASTDKNLPLKNLGYVEADLDHYFVLVHSFGSGNPHYIELIEKTTGENLLKQGSAWIDFDMENGTLLYSEKAVPRKNDKMILYKTATRKRESFPFPDEIFDGPEILNRIKIYKLSNSQFIIKYEMEKGFKTKTYSR